MTEDQVNERMKALGYEFQERQDQGHVIVLRYATGDTVSMYPHGLAFGGKDKDRLATRFLTENIPAELPRSQAAGAPDSTVSVPGTSPSSTPSTGLARKAEQRRVFVVYGHDIDSRDQLMTMLRQWEIQPVILDQHKKVGETVIEAVMRLSHDVHYGVVLMTPDDEGNLRSKPEEKACRSRQNVVFEAGVLMGALGRNQVAVIVQDKKDQKIELPSDLRGMLPDKFVDDVREVKIRLANIITKAGIPVHIAALDQ